MIINELKEDLMNSKIGSLIKNKETIAVLLIGSQVLPQSSDDTSDFDLLCLTKHGFSYMSPYIAEYKGQHLHGDYEPIGEAIGLERETCISRQHGLTYGMIEHCAYPPIILGIDDKYKGLIDFYYQHRKTINDILLYQAGYRDYGVFQEVQAAIDKPPIQMQPKDIAYLLIGIANVKQEEPNGDLIYRLKRIPMTMKVEGPTIRKELDGLEEYLKPYRFGILRKRLELLNECINKIMEVEGIDEKDIINF